MRRDCIAEGILGLATGREQASSIVGDLMESANAHGSIWFWSSLLCIAASLAWRDIVTDPFYMFGLAFRGWLMGQLLVLAFFLCIIIGAALFGLAHAMLAATKHSGLGTVSGGLLQWPLEVVGIGAATLGQFQVGRWIASAGSRS